MILYQLADDKEVYGEHAGHWVVVTNDLLKKLAGPYLTQEAAATAMLKLKQEGYDDRSAVGHVAVRYSGAEQEG